MVVLFKVFYFYFYFYKYFFSASIIFQCVADLWGVRTVGCFLDFVCVLCVVVMGCAGFYFRLNLVPVFVC